MELPVVEGGDGVPRGEADDPVQGSLGKVEPTPLDVEEGIFPYDDSGPQKEGFCVFDAALFLCGPRIGTC